MKKAPHVYLKVAIYQNQRCQYIKCIHILFPESKALYAVMMLVHLLPDTRTAMNTNRIVTFINVSYNKC